MALVIGALAAGCGNSLPGTVLGTYEVTANAGANTCGLGAPSERQFWVEISEKTTATSSTLYWSWLDHTPIASGPLAPISSSDATLQATLTASQTGNVDGTTAGDGPCTMSRNDALVVALGAGAPPASFSGTMSYAFAAATGADCSDQLTASGGAYEALPCTVSYTITGLRR